MKKLLKTLTLAIAVIGISIAPATGTVLAHGAAGPSATFTATDEQVFDPTTSYYSRYFNTQLRNISSSDGNPKIEYFLNGDLVGTNTKIFGNDGISIDVDQLANGDYKLSGKLTDTNGQTGTVMTLSEKEYLSFKVVNRATNPVTTAQTPVAATLDEPVIGGSDSAACRAKQATVSDIVERIVTRYQRQMKTIDGVNEKITEYSAHLDNTAEFQSALDAADKAGEKSDLAVLNLINTSKLTCASDGTYDVTQFKQALQDTRNAVKAYRESMSEAVKQLEAAV